jgi:hypothetical protein
VVETPEKEVWGSLHTTKLRTAQAQEIEQHVCTICDGMGAEALSAEGLRPYPRQADPAQSVPLTNQLARAVA